MRKDRIMKSLLAASLLGALAAASPATVNVPPVAAAGQGGKPAQSQARFRRVRVSAADIKRLPRGESYVLHLNDTPRKKAGGSTRFKPVVGDWDGDGTSATKTGTGTPTLSGTNTPSAAREEPALFSNKSVALRVYEFSSTRPIDFSRIVVQAGPDAAPVPLEAWLRKHRPAAGMKGWPFKRLLIGSPEGVAEIEGWKIKDATPGTDFECEGGGKDLSGEEDNYCGCSGILDCTMMVIAGKCNSELTCGDGQCFCTSD
jgi:hypothetical protein